MAVDLWFLIQSEGALITREKLRKSEREGPIQSCSVVNIAFAKRQESQRYASIITVEWKFDCQCHINKYASQNSIIGWTIETWQGEPMKEPTQETCESSLSVVAMNSSAADVGGTFPFLVSDTEPGTTPGLRAAIATPTLTRGSSGRIFPTCTFLKRRFICVSRMTGGAVNIPPNA